jgi:hypothetical protein
VGGIRASGIEEGGRGIGLVSGDCVILKNTQLRNSKKFRREYELYKPLSKIKLYNKEIFNAFAWSWNRECHAFLILGSMLKFIKRLICSL